MLRSVPMAHVRVQLPSRDAAAATRAIASEGLLHLVDIAHGVPPYDAAPAGTRELYAAFRDLTARVNAAASRLGLTLPEPTGALREDNGTDYAAEREKIALMLEPIEKRVDELGRAHTAARDQLARLRDQLANAERIARASLDANRLASLRFATLRLGIATPDTLPSLATMLSPAPFAIVPLAQEGESVFFAVAIANFAKGRLEEALRMSVVQPVELTRASAEEITAAVTRAEAEERAVLGRIEAERNVSSDVLRDLARRTELATLLLQAQTYFAAAGHFVVISGWVPESAAERLKKRIAAATGGRAIVEVAPAEALPGVAEGMLRVPILHRNPLLLRPFQKLIEIYGTPSYEEVQPATFFAITFLLMFGLMFGDVGHGTVLFAAGWLLFRWMPRFLDYGILLMEAGASSALFGLLYGSIFGIHGLLPVLWLEPIRELPRFMTIAIGLGVIVVSAGLVLNIVNAWRTRDWKGAIAGPKGITGALLYWVALVLIARAFVPVTAHVPGAMIGAIAAIALALLIAGPFVVRRLEHRVTRRAAPPVHATPWWLGLLESSVELVDTLFSFFANTISFVRVAAFAAVHAGVFIAIFALADTIAQRTFGGVLSILVHVAGNVVMILLEGLTVSVQVLRLEYYEFFGKFFRGGGEPYRPLTLTAPPEREAHHA